ncbi:MAG: nuclease-related domain-containing protein [Candidatus Rokubacteria bacterium]|nr:nuclease-related domain-containing protein [Candidatus Rokubacteria bacterium]
MKVLRAGGPYLSSQQGRYLLNLFSIVVAGGGGAVVVGIVLHPILGLLFALAWARPAFRQYARATRYRKGIRGEELVSSLLAGLSDDFYLINDVTLPGHRGNIDHVLVGPCGVVTIETKNYRGVIRCDRDQWFVDGRRIRSISRQVMQGAMAVKDCLSDRSAAFRTSRARWVESVVVFTNPLCRLEINRPGPTIVRYSELLILIAEKAKQRAFDAAQSSLIAGALARRAGQG